MAGEGREALSRGRGGIAGYSVQTMNPPVIGGAGEERDVVTNGGKNFLILRVGRRLQVSKADG